jgi:hypothetical protein
MPDEARVLDVLSELNVETRTILVFSVYEKNIEKVKWLPTGWKVNPAAGGPFKGGNLLLIFSDRLLVQDQDGKPIINQESNQLVVAGLLAQNPKKNLQGVVIAFGLSAKSDGAPGPYGVFHPANCSFTKQIDVKPNEKDLVKESWLFNNSAGFNISLELQYNRGIPVRADDAITKAFSLAKEDFYRIYRADQALDVLQSDGIYKKDFKIKGPILTEIFDGAEKLISVVSQPWTVRRVFVQPK